MAKVTSKLQLTVPKAIADQYGIRPGDELEWLPAGDIIRVIPPSRGRGAGQKLSTEQRLELFDRATRRHRSRKSALRKAGSGSPVRNDRGWKREDLYRRGLSD